MKVKTLKITGGYKRFHHLTIDLGENPARIVALVGPNGCGKSSVLDAMLYAHSAYTGIGSRGNRSGGYHSRDGNENFEHEKIRVIFDKGDFVTIINARSEKRNTIFSFRSCYRYNNQVKIGQTQATDPIIKNNYGATVASDLDEKMEQNYRRLHAKYNRYVEDTDSKPSEAKKKIIGDLNDSLERCLDLNLDSLGNIEGNQGTLYFKKPDHQKAFEFNFLSAGEKEAVDILLDLYLRRDDYDDTVFLIDEPELHINTAVQRKLLVEMNRLIGDNCQLWVATHSAGFLRALQADLKDQSQIIQFKQGVPYASATLYLTPVVPTLKVWRSIFETALDDIAGLVSPVRIIYCEGTDKPGAGGKEKGLDAEVFNTIFGAKYADTQFVSSGGNTELDQRSAIALAVLSKVFPTVEIWVLKDRDMASGKVTTETDRQLYLKNNSNEHRVMKRWEIENYLYDKEVLTAYCAHAATTFDESKYYKLVSNIVDEDVKGMTSGIKTACGIIGSVNTQVFKTNLAGAITPNMAVYKELEDCIFRRA